jgi:hypothetical protein
MPEPGWVRTRTSDGGYVESLGGVLWADAPLPPRWHRCTTQTRGWIGLNWIERCACGATKLDGRWIGKNETRHHRAQARKDARAPKETVTCRNCGQPYEAVAGSPIARARQCTTCWADDLIAEELM